MQNVSRHPAASAPADLAPSGGLEAARLQARAASETRKWAPAARAWRRVLDADPCDKEALEKLVVALRRSQRFAEADALLEGRLTSGADTDRFFLLLNHARVAFSRGDYAEACRRWRRVIEMRPRHFEAHLRLAGALQELGDYSAAAQHVAAAQTLKPDSAELVLPLLRQSIHRRDAVAVAHFYPLISKSHRERLPPVDLAEMLLEAGDAQGAAAILDNLPVPLRDEASQVALRLKAAAALSDRASIDAAVTSFLARHPPGKRREGIWSLLSGIHAAPAARAEVMAVLASDLASHASVLARMALDAHIPDLTLDLLTIAADESPTSELLAINALLAASRVDEAVLRAEALVHAMPDDVVRLDALARAQAARCDWAAAVSVRERIRAVTPADTQNIRALARDLAEAGRPSQAEETLLGCFHVAPAEAWLYYDLGLLAVSRGFLRRAHSYLRHACRLDPQDSEAFRQLGTVCVALDLRDEAVAAFAACLSLTPWHFSAWSKLRACEGAGANTEWAAHLAALRAKPAPTASEWQFLIQAHMEMEGSAAALHLVEAACAAHPRNPKLLRVRARCERLSGNWSAAMRAINEVSALRPADPRNHDEKLQILCGAGDFGSARAHVECQASHFRSPALRRRAVGLLTHLHLGLGELREGFAIYRESWLSELVRQHLGEDRFAASVDAVRPDERLLVLPAWGIGDEVNWSAIYPEIAERHASVVFGADPRLIPLLRRSFPDLAFQPIARWHRREEIPPASRAAQFGALPDLALAAVMDGPTWLETANFDRVAIATDLLADFRGDRAAFPSTPALLQADQAAIAVWRARLAALGPGAKVGIAWTSQVRTALRKVHLTQLRDWEPVFQVPGVQFVALQADCGEEGAAPGGGFLHRFPDLDTHAELDRTAALIGALDIVISVVNSSAELAGALGRPTLLLNRSHTLDWRVADAAGSDLLHPSQRHVIATPRHDVGALMTATATLLRDRLNGMKAP